MSKNLTFREGSKRINSKFILCVKKFNSWSELKQVDKNLLNILDKYDENEYINEILDTNELTFLKGYLDYKERPSGSRITILPNGDKIARGGFSLFAKDLKFNCDKRKLWDVCYRNTSGSQTYLYSEKKVSLEQKQKTKKVDLFEKWYPTIISKLEEEISKSAPTITHIALYILLLTHIRIGNLEYYHRLKHKGLTTLQKEDFKIEENTLVLDFIGKDGIPQHIVKAEGIRDQKVWNKVLGTLAKKLSPLHNKDFIFTKNNNLLHSQDFSKLLFNYTGEHFYPHIIRSFYADSKCKEFLKTHKKPTYTEVKNQFKSIAKELGHKKYNKKKQDYLVEYKVTLTNYIRPELSEKMKIRVIGKH
jgi:hypothetical protein